MNPLIFTEGDVVQLLNSSLIGIVARVISDELLLIQSGQQIFPAHIGAVIFRNTSLNSKNTFVNLASDNQLFANMGVMLAFDPILDNLGNQQGYTIYLINDTPDTTIHSFTFKLNGLPAFNSTVNMEPNSSIGIGKLQHHQLNEQPEFETKSWRSTTEGYDEPINKNLKIKAKQFFNNYQPVPILLRHMHLFKLFDSLMNEEKKSLKDVAANHVSDYKKPPIQKNNLKKVLFKHTFSPSLDLHIEKLTNLYSKLEPVDMLNMQMKSLKEYIEDAVIVGMDTVYIIHGIGKGTLKKEIHAYLDEHPHVLSFKNEYHHNYGFGATEVRF